MKLTVYFGVSLYSNRIINQDLTEAEKTALTFDNINFIFADGINTIQTLNGDFNNIGANSPSYLQVDNPDGTLNSYWWIVSTFQQNAKQITLTLRRDFLRQYWEQLKTTPFLVQKSGTIPENLSYARFSKTMNLSQVKKSEIQITDREGAKGWLVVYIAKKTDGSSSLTDKVLSNGNYKIDFTKHSHIPTEDVPYEILAIPLMGSYSADDDDGATFHFNLSVFAGKVIAQQFSLTLGSSVYDIQWIPYVTEQADSSGHFSKSDQNYIIYDGTLKVGICRILTLSTASRSINVSSIDAMAGIVYDLQGLTPTEERIYEEEHYFRLVSPNYSSQFEFSPIRNGASFGNQFHIDMGLKPFNPYFYIYPTYSNEYLYGGIYRDGRGLILSGDMSLDQVSSAWTEYQLQNKNYELAFNRQIQSMDLKNEVAEENANWKIVNSVLGTATSATKSAIKGATAGSIVPGVGTVAGAVVGAVTGAVGGVMDITESARAKSNTLALNNDAKDNAITQFQYQLGNIQAIPNTLTKVSATNPDFKVYPILEVYECTWQEKTNLENSIKYNGIEINQVATLGDFDKGYVSGVLLQFPLDLNINQEQSDAIQNELAYGIYLKEV